MKKMTKKGNVGWLFLIIIVIGTLLLFLLETFV